MTSETATKHPARFSDAILVEMGRMIPAAKYPTVLDPFAGVGRVHELPNETVGVEIEPEWAGQHQDTICGDSTHLVALFKRGHQFDAIATSPVYGNRMSDHHEAKDDSVRHTYKHYLGRDLAPNNAGQMHFPTKDYLALHENVWAQAVAMLRVGGRFVLNVKNFIEDGMERPVVGWHTTTLCRMGMRLVAITPISAPGHRHGANHAARVEHEWVLTFVKEPLQEPTLFDTAQVAPLPDPLMPKDRRLPTGKPVPGTGRWLVLNAIVACPFATDAELALRLDGIVNANAIRPRRKELADAGYITGSSNGVVALWSATQLGIEAVR